MFYECLTLIGSCEGRKNLGEGIFKNKNLLQGYRKQTTFFFRPYTVIPIILIRLLCQKGQSTLQLCPSRWCVSKIFDYNPKKVKIENSW